MLRETQKIGGPAALLLEVGSFPGRGEIDDPAVHDLSGNVAEWTLDAAGQGALRGESADTLSRSKDSRLGVSVPCQGFRVVLADD